MNLPLFIAKNYFLSRKKKNFINVISIIGMLALAVGCAALIIILSFFNGLEDLIKSLHSSFDPEIKISAVHGKSFIHTEELDNTLESIEGVKIVTEVIEENAYVKYRNSTMIVTIKGVEDNFLDHHRLDEKIVHGSFKLKDGGIDYAVIGVGVKYTLGIVNLKELFAIHVYYPNRKTRSALNPTRLTKHKTILPSGAFAIEKQYDLNYMFVPLSFAESLLDYGSRRTSLEIKVKEGYSIESVQNEIKKQLGEKYLVQNSDEQHASLIKAVGVEKLIVFLILALVIFILSFNIFFSLTMLAMDKQKDISVLFSLGATSRLIKKVFYWESLLISAIGMSVGLFLGTVFCLLQLKFGLIKLGMASAVMENYPVKIIPTDYLNIILLILIITYLASVRPAGIATNVKINEHL